MENKIMETVNEEVVTDVADVVTEETGKGFKIMAGIGLAALAGVVIYKVGKKVVAKIKAKKAEAVTLEDVEYAEIDHCEDGSNKEI